MMADQGMRRDLTQYDLINIIVGSIVGADIYIASAITAGMLGPFSIVIWILAGLCATIIALVFAYCSYYVPRVGGPFAFVSEAFDEYFGFLAGWSLWIAELMALPVFAIAFVKYLQYIVPLGTFEELAIKALFIGILTGINILGVKLAGKVTDVLTVIKLFPLVILILAGFALFFIEPQRLLQNYSPFIPLGLDAFGPALVLVFWAYVGFEMGTLPAAEVIDPKKTIPKAIIIGMSIVTTFYLLTNFVVYGTVHWSILAQTSTPLVIAGAVLFGSVGSLMMAIGALFSVSGSDEPYTLGIARLSYALSIDGLFPRVFSRLHPVYGTPYYALLIQAGIAFILSMYDNFSGLISFSVFNFAFSFLLTCFALIVLKKRKEKGLIGQHLLPWIGIFICLYLLYSTTLFDKILGTAVILLGIPVYIYFSPKQDIQHLKDLFLSEEEMFIRRVERNERFLARLVRFLHHLYIRVFKFYHRQ